jgi:hypothetical protein
VESPVPWCGAAGFVLTAAFIPTGFGWSGAGGRRVRPVGVDLIPGGARVGAGLSAVAAPTCGAGRAGVRGERGRPALLAELVQDGGGRVDGRADVVR